jgi:NADPH-dependent curcumin reductase CurA
MAEENRQFRLAARPVGAPKPSDWSLVREAVPSPGEGEFLVRISHISLDPAMRGWMNAGRSYIEPVEIGAVMRAGAGGEVVASHHPGFQVGEHVVGAFGVQTFAVSNGKGVTKVDAKVLAMPNYLGALGMTGMTAYFGLLDVGKPRAGDTVVVSGAAGAVGTVVGQIAKIKGCRVVGIAGGEAKTRMLIEDLGFDAAIDYKREDVRKGLQRHCPKGLDVYFDNVGVPILDAALANLARGARVVLCGAISQYNSAEGIKGPSNYLALLVARASMTGMVVFDYADRYDEARREMAAWMREGRLKSLETVISGFEIFPEALMKLFSGENTGKLVLAV